MSATSGTTPLSTANRIADQIEDASSRRNNHPAGSDDASHRTVARSLIFTCGTTAAHCASQIKGRLDQPGHRHLTLFRVLDTDESAQSGVAGWRSFSDDEFLLLSTNRVSQVIENPDAHPELVERYELQNPKNMASLKRLVSEGPTQAGQVRALGNLCFQANFPQVRTLVRTALRSLTDAHTDLKQQLVSDEEITVSRRITIYVLFSNAGGTGASIACELMSLLRHETRNLDVEIIAYMFMPSTFETALAGHPTQQLRISASAFATMLEWQNLRNGLLSGQLLGPGGRNSFTAQCNFCDQLYVVGPRQANGRALSAPQGVIDSVALALAGQIGTEVRDQLKVNEANQATLRGMAPDPQTGNDRDIGTVGATALALPVDRISRYCTALTIEKFIRKRVLPEASSKEVAADAAAWINRRGAKAAFPLEPAAMTRTLKGVILPKPDRVVHSLFRHVGPQKSVHLSTREFLEQADKLLCTFRNVQLGEMETRLNNYAEELIGQLQNSFSQAVSRIAESSGYLAVKRFAGFVAEQQTQAIGQLSRGMAAEQKRAEAALAKANETLAVLGKSARNFFKDSSRRSRAAGLLQSYVVYTVDGLAMATSRRILEAVHDMANKQRDLADSIAENARNRLVQVRELLQNSKKNSEQITTTSVAEIDVSSPEIDVALYHGFKPNDNDLLKSLAQLLQVPPAIALERLAGDTSAFETLIEVVSEKFNAGLQKVSIVDVIADLLNSSGGRQEMQARIRQMVLGCQPMWEAESGQLSTGFSETLLIGIPRSHADSKHALVKSAVLGAATRCVNPDGQYNSEPCPVEISDPHRIYVIRMTQGACFHYLPEVAACKNAYDEWNRIGGHTVHTFNDRIVSRFDGLLPLPNASRDDAGFALALAYSFVVQRGPRWYWNLDVSETGFKCSLSSHRNSLIFHDGKLLDSPGTMKQLIDQGRAQYQAHDTVVSAEIIGESLQEAQAAFRENLEMQESVEQVIRELRATVGDVAVAEEIAEFGQQLKSGNRADRDGYQLTRIGEILSTVAAKLTVK